MVKATNIDHWPICNGNSIADSCNMKEFIFINDFEAAGYGVLNLTDSQYTNLNDVRPNGNVKAVIGPGTGLGECLIHKSHGSNYYDVIPCEGGHCDFAVRSQEDWELMNFAIDYVENSENVENDRATSKITRVSNERLLAGPAVPLIYKYMESKHKDINSSFRDNMEDFNKIKSYDIVNAAIQDKDPLCLKVVEKFTEFYGVEAGNLALKCLPFGGVYLIGGVTNGIREYLMTSDTFLHNFYSKGRIESKIRQVPVYLVSPDVEVGIEGAVEYAFKHIGKNWN